MIRKASKVTVPVMAREMTEARIGPTQGVQRSPRDRPIKIPPRSPVLFCLCGIKFASLENNLSRSNWNWGMRSDAPKPAIITIDNPLRRFAEIPLIWTIVERNSVKKVKLRINPITTPNGRDLSVFCPPIVEVRIIGKIGKMHGESMVTIPAKNANPNKSIMSLFLSYVHLFLFNCN